MPPQHTFKALLLFVAFWAPLVAENGMAADSGTISKSDKE